jgi:hypothetical protein
MTKDRHDHRSWTNKELEEDPQGYLAAQERYREDQAKAVAKRREDDFPDSPVSARADFPGKAKVPTIAGIGVPGAPGWLIYAV